jgi:hypothetical protein
MRLIRLGVGFKFVSLSIGHCAHEEPKLRRGLHHEFCLDGRQLSNAPWNQFDYCAACGIAGRISRGRSAAAKMGADIVIAVYLDTGPFNKTALESPLGVAGRNVQILIAANELKSMKDANILLKADVSKFNSGDFEKSAEIIPKGVEVAQEHAAEFSAGWNDGTTDAA